MKKLFFAPVLFLCLIGTAQIKLEVKFSKAFATFEFIQHLSAQSGPNSFRKIFSNSTFDNEKYQSLLKRFGAIPIYYEYPYNDYPAFTKRGQSIEYMLKLHLINASDFSDFKIRSLGLIPISDLNELILIIEKFLPVYEELVYVPHQTIFEKQQKDIKDMLVFKNIAAYFEQAMLFYNTSWDKSMPFVLTFYPLPNSKGFTATTYGNTAISAIPTTLTDYNLLLSVLLHEFSHVLYDEQPLAFKNEIDNWFASNPSKFSRYAYNLLNESWATAVGNGYFYEKLNGALMQGNWYNSKYISTMGRQMYPHIRVYIDNKKPIDKVLVDQYVRMYEDSIPNSINELDYILNGRYGIADNKQSLDSLDELFPPRFVSEYYHDFSRESFEKLKKIPITKVIIINSEHKRKIALIKENFPELKNWQPNPEKDFSSLQLVADRTQLLVISLVKKTMRELLRR